MNSASDSPPSQRKRSAWRAKVVVSVGAILVGCFLAEGATRLTGRFQPPPYPPACGRPELYEPYEPYGYRLHPSRTMQYEYPRHNPRTLTVVSNPHGFRSQRDPLVPCSPPRIVFLGDSFVFGEGVEQAERFTNVLASRQPTWCIDNLGMTGFGLDTMLRAYEEIGIRAQPDVLIICVYGDDLRRVDPYYAGVGFEIPRFELRDDRLVSIPYPRRRFWQGLHLAELGRRVHWKWTDAERKLNTALLERLLELAHQHQTQPGIVYLPARQDLPVDVRRRTWLAEFAQTHDCPFVDLTASVLRVGDDAFIERNWHYNAVGHTVTADAVEDFLDEHFFAGATRATN